MKIKAEIYYGLIMAFVVLIVVTFFLMYQYNQERQEVVAELESRGYVCLKDPFGFYKSCTHPDDLIKLGIDIEFNEGQING